MSSSSNNGNPFGYFPYSSYLSLPIPTHDSGDPIYLHYHHDLLQGHSLLPLPVNHPQMTESLLNMAMLNNSAQMMETFDESGFLTQKKPPVKKDRHSKICTAQGVRDRRVRLSTDIAREFFDLQDMLGFDKASKTLGWLLNKSKNAIKKAAKMKSSGSTAFSTTSSDCELVSDDDDGSKGKEIVDSVYGDQKKMKRMQKADILRLEAREKARARARERTREKMCNQNLNQFKKSCSIMPQECEDHNHLGIGSREDDVFQGSKRKMKLCPILGNQQNACFPDFPYNQIWDISGETGLGQYPNISAGSSDDLNLSKSGT